MSSHSNYSEVRIEDCCCINAAFLFKQALQFGRTRFARKVIRRSSSYFSMQTRFKIQVAIKKYVILSIVTQNGYLHLKSEG